nr:glycosyltransferase family 2 protein [Pseudoxanthomonas sp.]
MNSVAATPGPEETDTRVSVIMPVYNAEQTLLRSAESVLAQTFGRVELILIDDGSRDGSAAIIAELAARDDRVVAIRQANAGVAAARNAGLRAARGTHIAFLDSDDWWVPRKLELQLARMRQTGARICYASYQRVAEDGRLLSKVSPPLSVDYRRMLGSNHIGNLTGIYERGLGEASFQRMGHEDYVFWLERVRQAGSAVRVEDDEPLAYYLVRNGSVSANKLRAAGWQWRIYRQVEGLSAPRAAWYMIHYIRNALWKRKPMPT